MHVSPRYADEVVDTESDAGEKDEEDDDNHRDDVVLFHLGRLSFFLLNSSVGGWCGVVWCGLGGRQPCFCDAMRMRCAGGGRDGAGLGYANGLAEKR